MSDQMFTPRSVASASPSPASGARLDPLPAVALWLARDGHVALATVIETWGSAPVRVGGVMVIGVDGQFEGSVSGGCIEGEIIAEAAECLADGRVRSLSFGVADETAWGAGLPCGGKVRVLLERLDKAPHGDLARRMADVSARRGGLVLRKSIATGAVEVFAPGEPRLPDDISQRFRTGKSGLITGADGEQFLHAILPPARIIAIGASHISQVLARLAQAIGYEMHVIDPRTAFATPARFAGVHLHAEWPEAALARIGVDAFTAVAVLAHVDHIDDEALNIALRSPARYVGALGSRRTHGRRIERLAAAGFTAAELARIKNPIGLDIGAETPQEIALSVMAEIVAAVRKPAPV